LTDRDFFRGSLADLATARAAVNLPVLRKDFTISPLHVLEAAAHGADAILLIAAILTVREMRDFRELATRYGLDALVEVHDVEELRPALDSGARIVGVNNRNLRTFETRLDITLQLLGCIPSGRVVVTESGILAPADVTLMRDHHVDGFLVGEAFMRADDPGMELARLFG